MLPESLTENQKRFLRRQYRLDVDNPVRSPRRHRFQIMFLWVMPLLVVGLLGLDVPDAAKLSERPGELLTWALAAVFAAGNIFVLIYFFVQTRQKELLLEKPAYPWYALFRDNIGPRSPVLVRWTHLLAPFAVLLAAASTDRWMLAFAWSVAMAMGFVRECWELRQVRWALATIDATARTDAN